MPEARYGVDAETRITTADQYDLDQRCRHDACVILAQLYQGTSRATLARLLDTAAPKLAEYIKTGAVI